MAGTQNHRIMQFKLKYWLAELVRANHFGESLCRPLEGEKKYIDYLGLLWVNGRLEEKAVCAHTKAGTKSWAMHLSATQYHLLRSLGPFRVVISISKFNMAAP